MSAQLKLLSGAGFHNDNIERRTSEVRQGGSWKKQRTIAILPASDLIPAKVALSHWSLAFPPNQAVHRMLALGTEVGEAYSGAIEAILAEPNLKDWEFILTIEHDNMPPFDGVVRLIEQMEKHPELSCIGGLYWCKGPGGCPHIWGDVKDPIPNYRPQPPDPNGGLVECYGTSMGFNVWRLSMFKDDRLRKPWFKTYNGTEGMGIGTQDLAFWGDARKYGYRCAVDCSVKVGHYDHAGAFGRKNLSGKAAVAEETKPVEIKFDLGCGPNKKEGFTGVDVRQFDGKVDVVCDLSTERWPWDDGTVTEVHASHFLEHLKPMERVHFANELYRVLIPEGKATVITPSAFSERAYGDLTHQWPPVVGFWFYYLDKNWRAGNAPHNDFYTCDFNCTWGFSMHPGLANRVPEYQQHALTYWKEAAQDQIATLIARKSVVTA